MGQRIGSLLIRYGRTARRQNEIREGTVVDADDLMEAMIETAKETSAELGKLDGLTQKKLMILPVLWVLGALKYFILKVDARKNMTFNPKESIDFNGNTGPFIQYTYARIQSVLTESGRIRYRYSRRDSGRY